MPNSTTSNRHPADRLAEAIDRVGSPACVGIDPVLDRLPAELDKTEAVRAIESFCLGVVDAVAGVAPAVKPQSACYERFGSAGVAVLERVIARARDAGLVVVLDVKRGDIGSTADHYAAAASGMGADWVTANPYMGASAIEPFLDAGLGVYALVRTSNPDARVIQSAPLASGESVAAHVARFVAELGAEHIGAGGMSSLGAVVGATLERSDLSSMRGAMPDAPMLVPGVGAQGGDAEAARLLDRAGAGSAGSRGVLINASRSVIFPDDDAQGGSWTDRIRRAAESFAQSIR